MITAAVISDTHNLLRPTVLEQLAGCDIILHGGDICRQEIVDRLRETAPLCTALCGTGQQRPGLGGEDSLYSGFYAGGSPLLHDP